MSKAMNKYGREGREEEGKKQVPIGRL